MGQRRLGQYGDAHDLLVQAINSGGDGAQIGEDLFGASDLLTSTHSLCDSLTDPSRSNTDKLALAKEVFGPVVSGAALEVLDTLVEGHWSSPGAFSKAVGELGLDSYILMAMHGDECDSLCQELIDAQTLVTEHRQLRVQLSDIGEGGPDDRAALARSLFDGRVSPIAERLIVRAAYTAHYGQLIQTLRSYAERAAAVTKRRLVVVYTAAALSSDQYHRLERLAARRWNTSVLIVTVVDPALIGGFRLDAGDQSVDTTVRRDLALAREALTR